MLKTHGCANYEGEHEVTSDHESKVGLVDITLLLTEDIEI